MRKSNKLFKTYYVLCVMSALSLLLLSHNTSALEYGSSTNIQFTFNPTISMNLSSSDLVIPNLSPGSYADSNIITINVATNNVTGYTLTATVGNSTNPSHNTTNLTNISNSNYQFTSLSSPVSTLDTLPTNTWGYNYSNDNGTTWHNYAALPLYSDTSSPSATLSSPTIASNDSIKFKIGARADSNLPAGTYTNTINFYAVAKQTPTTFYDAFAAAGKQQYNGYYKMQDMTSNICESVYTSQLADNSDTMEAQLVDIRDGNIYCVAKLKDNNCWMTQNLRITGVILAEYSNFVTSPYSNNEDSIDTFAGGDLRGSNSTYTMPQSHLADATDAASSNNQYTATQLGAWYNYCAASAGEVCQSDTAQDATQDICPSNWALPTLSQNVSLVSHISPDDSLFKPIYGGHYWGGTLYDTTVYGNWWSSTAWRSVSQYILRYINDAIDAYDVTGKQGGLYIRCLAK